MTCNLYCTRCLRTRIFLVGPESYVCSACALEMVRIPTTVGAFRRVPLKPRRPSSQAG